MKNPVSGFTVAAALTLTVHGKGLAQRYQCPDGKQMPATIADAGAGRNQPPGKFFNLLTEIPDGRDGTDRRDQGQ
jgi:hypothetical protein